MAPWKRALAVVSEAEQRGDPIPQFIQPDHELAAISDVLGILSRIDADRRVHVLGYVIERARMEEDMARRLVAILSKEMDQ